MKLAGCFKGYKDLLYVNDQGTFDFSCHDSFKLGRKTGFRLVHQKKIIIGVSLY